MPIQVYGMALSTCTQRVLTTLTEKGLKYELINIDLFKGEQKVKYSLKKLLFRIQSLCRTPNISKKSSHLVLFLYSSMKMDLKFMVS
jgi:hypothetical protein